MGTPLGQTRFKCGSVLVSQPDMLERLQAISEEEEDWRTTSLRFMDLNMM